MAFKDLREWVDRLEKEDELARIKAKVDWNLEIGGIAQEGINKKGPALLFENIKDYENTVGKSLFTNSLATFPRIAMAMGLPKDTPPLDIIKIFMERIRTPIKPVGVKSGPVKENIFKGEHVNLLEFPAPKWHDRDGGQYIGTFDGVVTKDPETGWVNIGIYRRQIHDRNHTGITIIHGQHIWMHWRKYRKLGRKTMPIAMINGWDPILPLIASSPFPVGVCEYDMMGAIRQEPVELVKCETVDLEVPATAEIVIEGEISLDFDSFKFEGPFGEHLGYYASQGSKKPVVTWNCLTCRTDPVLQGTFESPPTNESDNVVTINHSSLYWDYLNRQMPGVTGVHIHSSGMVFVQVDNSYFGQPQQVAYAIWGHSGSPNFGKHVMVVDQDIDIFDPDKLFWAFYTRVYPPRDILQAPGAVQVVDPGVHPKDRISVPGETTYMTTRLLIDATKYLGNPRTEIWYGEKFAPLCYPDESTMEHVRKRWKEYGIEEVLHKRRGTE